MELVVERVKRVQGTLERPFALENVSSYMTYRASSMTEWDFVSEVAERADCGLLLDCNNVYVSARNHGFDAERYIDGVPADRVVQMHLAGHTDKGSYVLDTHSDHVCDEVWSLYRRAIARCGAGRDARRMGRRDPCLGGPRRRGRPRAPDARRGPRPGASA